MNHCKILTILTTILFSQAVGAQTLQQTIEKILSDPALSESTIGICVRTGDGKTLAEIESDNMILPASNMKLISTGAAMHRLGPDYRYATRIAHDGQIENGILKGNLYIIGAGDPTTGSKDSIATPLTQVFAQWEKLVRDAGIKRIAVERYRNLLWIRSYRPYVL